MDELENIKNKEDDIIYATITVTYIESIGSKRKPRYDITYKTFDAQIKGFNSKSGNCTLTGYEKQIRKNSKYIEIIKTLTKDEFENSLLKSKKLDDSQIRAEKKKSRALIKTLPAEVQSLIEKKIKKANTLPQLSYLQYEIKDELEKFEKSLILKASADKVTQSLNNIPKNDFIELEDWVKLDKQDRHPAPKNIYEIKSASNLSWTEFEELVINQKIGA